MSDEDNSTVDASPTDTSEPLDPSGIAQFVEHDRCSRYIKQRVAPGEEADARDWREAYGLMNVALLGHGQEFEAMVVERLAANAQTIIGPDLDDPTTDGVPDIDIDETWHSSPRGRTAQLQDAIEAASALDATADPTPYILLYQAPLDGTLGAHDIHGDADCIVLAPAPATTTASPHSPPATDTPPDTDTPVERPESDLDTAHDREEAPTDPPTPSTDTTEPATHASTTGPDEEPDVVARVIDCKSAHEEKPGHRVQVALYTALLDRTLAEGPADPTCRIEASVLTKDVVSDTAGPLDPFGLPTFRRTGWEWFATRLLVANGPIEDALRTPLEDLPFTIDQTCDNCAFREACATRAVEDPTAPASLALLGVDAPVQETLAEAGITSLRDLAELAPPIDNPQPTNEPPTLDLPTATRDTLEEALPEPIHATVQRAQALASQCDPAAPEQRRPQAIPGTGWVPLPDDRCENWSNIDGAQPGELITIALIVRPDTTIDRLGALGACVSAGGYDDYITIGETIDAIPDDPAVASAVEYVLLERFLEQLFDAIETVAAELGDPEQAVVHIVTYSEHERETLAEGLDRHADRIDAARALRAMLSCHPDGHTAVDQSLVTPVQPVLNEHFALQYPNQGLLSVAEQFLPTWTLEAFDPLDGRPDEPPLRVIFREQFLNSRVPYLEASPGISLHLAPGPLAEGPAADVADTDADAPSPDGWYPVRKRPGTQFPLEYLWAVTPRNPGETTPRLTPETVEAWAVDEEAEPLYRQEIERFYYRTPAKDEPLARRDLEYLLERLGYALWRLVDAIPYKDTYHEKTPIDATSLDAFELPVGDLPAAARDTLRMEFGARREDIVSQYRQPLRRRARSGRSVPIRCTDCDLLEDGLLSITAELAYDALFDDPETVTAVARRARLRDGSGPGGGSWRVLTGLQAQASPGTDDTSDGTSTTGEDDVTSSTGGATDSGATANEPTYRTVESPSAIKHSPPVIVETIDPQAGTLTLTALPHRLRQHGSRFRTDHCGWTAPEGSNCEDPSAPPSEREGYVAGRPPVQIEPGRLYMLDPMIDDLGAPKADRALEPQTITENALYGHLETIREQGNQPPVRVADPDGIEAFLAQVADAEACLAPNPDQQAFIRTIDRPVVPLQGPPGTGKTSGATAPALLARAFARARNDRSFTGLVVAPSHEAVEAVLEGVEGWLADWQASETPDTFADLELVRVLPTAPSEDAEGESAVDREQSRRQATTANPDAASEQDQEQARDVSQSTVTRCSYRTDRGKTILTEVARTIDGPATDDNASQQLVFVTPTTLYHVLTTIAETLPAIDGESAPAAMRHRGLVDVVCCDEASMLTIPQLLLAGSTVSPQGQTLLVGDHRQLATVSAVEWEETLRKPLAETQAYRSAIEYVRRLARVADRCDGDGDGDGDPTADANTGGSGGNGGSTGSSGSTGSNAGDSDRSGGGPDDKSPKDRSAAGSSSDGDGPASSQPPGYGPADTASSPSATDPDRDAGDDPTRAGDEAIDDTDDQSSPPGNSTATTTREGDADDA